jgi:hypothetical protein
MYKIRTENNDNLSFGIENKDKVQYQKEQATVFIQYCQVFKDGTLCF